MATGYTWHSQLVLELHVQACTFKSWSERDSKPISSFWGKKTYIWGDIRGIFGLRSSQSYIQGYRSHEEYTSNKRTNVCSNCTCSSTLLSYLKWIREKQTLHKRLEHTQSHSVSWKHFQIKQRMWREANSQADTNKRLDEVWSNVSGHYAAWRN